MILRRQVRKSSKSSKLQNEASPAHSNDLRILSRLAKAAARPVYLQFTEPLLMACTIWSGFSFGTVFLFTQSVEQVYSRYGWRSWDISYIQISVAIGEALGWALTLFGTRLYLKSASRNRECPGHPIPEARLYVSTFGSFVLISGGMFVYAWTTHVHWIVPAIGLAFVGAGIQTVVSAVADYIEDAYASSDCKSMVLLELYDVC